MRIIYQTDEGGVAVIIPTPEALINHSIEAIANKDVPADKPYHIVQDSDVPSDRTFRGAWEVDVVDLVSGVGSVSSTFNK